MGGESIFAIRFSLTWILKFFQLFWLLSLCASSLILRIPCQNFFSDSLTLHRPILSLSASFQNTFSGSLTLRTPILRLSVPCQNSFSDFLTLRGPILRQHRSFFKSVWWKINHVSSNLDQIPFYHKWTSSWMCSLRYWGPTLWASHIGVTFFGLKMLSKVA